MGDKSQLVDAICVSALGFSSLLLLAMPCYGAFFFTVAVGAIVLGVCLFAIFANKKTIQFGHWLAASVLLDYAAGTLFSFSSSDSIARAMDAARVWPALCECLALVYIASLLLLMFDNVVKAAFYPKPEALSPNASLFLILICTSLIVIAILHGDIGFMGNHSDDTHHVSILGSLASVASIPLLGLCGYALPTEKRSNKWWLILFCTIAVFMIVCVSGRRNFGASIILFAFGYVLAGGARSASTIRIVLGASVFIVVGYLGSTYFYSLRTAGYMFASATGVSASQASILDRMAFANKILGDRQRYASILSSYQQNVTERSFNIMYLADLVYHDKNARYGYGGNLWREIRVTIPSVLDSNKQDLLDSGANEESFVNPRFGIPVLDCPNSILTAGMGDYGPIGAIFYPLGFVLLIYLANGILRRLSGDFVELSLFMTLSISAILFVPDVELSTYLAMVRDSVILFVVFGAAYFVTIKLLPGTILRPQSL
ncbi:MAG: hypothetical protein P4L87_26295 [Formivibrio sp.]|nr:hypothetical protein [Formivibrio sp.]